RARWLRAMTSTHNQRARRRKRQSQGTPKMPHPLVIAYHLVWTAYGWWLPNDPRGSGSATLRNDVLAVLVELHFGRKALQPSGKAIRAYYERAADLLKHPLLTFDEACRLLIAEAFATVIAEQGYTCYACAIMP